MIIVVEGISAAGKSTWCRRHAPTSTVAEKLRLRPPSDEPTEEARFWVQVHADRWAEALRLERAHGSAYCDTDPVKLHYAWSLWRLGAISGEHWRAARDEHLSGFKQRKLGFADLVLHLDPGVEFVRAQREADDTRGRRNFSLHVRLAPYLREWYGALETLSPGRVVPHLAGATVPPGLERRVNRYDVDLLRELCARLG